MRRVIGVMAIALGMMSAIASAQRNERHSDSESYYVSQYATITFKAALASSAL